MDEILTSVSSNTVDFVSAVPIVMVAFLSGMVIAAAYMWRNKYTQSVVLALSMLPAIVCVVIMMVNGNLGAGVAVAGAFSLVRFRSAPGSGRDIAFVFLAMACGLAAGMGYPLICLGIAVLICALYIAIVLLRFGGDDNKAKLLRVAIPESLDYVGLFDDILSADTLGYELLESKTGGMGTVYKLSWKIQSKDDEHDKELIDNIRCRNGNLEVSLSNYVPEAL